MLLWWWHDSAENAGHGYWEWVVIVPYLFSLHGSFYFCCKLPHIWWLRTTQMYFLIVLQVKLWNCLTGLKSQGVCIPAGGHKEESIAKSFPPSRGCLYSLAHDSFLPSSKPEIAGWIFFPFSLFYLSYLEGLLGLITLDPPAESRGHTYPLWGHWINLNSPLLGNLT